MSQERTPYEPTDDELAAALAEDYAERVAAPPAYSGVGSEITFGVEHKRKRPTLGGPELTFKRRRAVREPVGLSIGASHLRAAVVRDGLVARVLEHPLPYGVIQRGMLVDPDRLTRELRQFFKRASFGTSEVNFSVQNRGVTLRTLDLPVIESDVELSLAVKNMAPPVLEPVDPKKAVIDFAELSRSGFRLQVQLAAADREMVRAYTRAVEKAGLEPLACEITALAESRALTIPRDPDCAHAVVNVGAETTSFIAAAGPDVYFMRVMDIGGNDYTISVAETIGCSFEEAEAFKRRAGLAVTPADSTLDPELFAACQDAMLLVSDQLAAGISDSRRFYQHLPEGRRVDGLTLLGGGAELPGLRDQLALGLGLEAGAAQLKEGLNVDGSERYGAALGLALGHRMSLLPEENPAKLRLTPTRRAVPKVTTGSARSEARKIRSGRKAPRTNPNLIGALIGVAILTGSFEYGKNLKAENQQLQAPAAHRPAVLSTWPTYQSSQQPAAASLATTAAADLAGAPDLQTIASALPGLISRFGVTSPALSVNWTAVTFNGVAASASQAQRLAQAFKALPGVSSATSTGTGTSKHFSLQITTHTPS